MKGICSDTQNLEFNQDGHIAIRVWLSNWMLPVGKMKLPTPLMSTLSVYECRLTEHNYEYLGFSWHPPFRKDLTPDVEYHRYSSEYLLNINGNSTQGARAIILPPQHFNIEHSSLFLNLYKLHTILPSEYLRDVVQMAKWKHIKDVQHQHYFRENTDISTQIPVSFCQHSYSNELGHRVLQAMFTNGIVSALDMQMNDINERKPEWSGVIDGSFRILEWQPLGEKSCISNNKELTINKTIPRIAIWEEVCDRPILPIKSYHRRSIIFIEILSIPSKELLINNWKALLPQMKILDTMNGTATKETSQNRDDSLAWNYLHHTTDGAEKFRKILQQKMLSDNTTFFQPLACHSKDKSVTPIGTFAKPIHPFCFFGENAQVTKSLS